MWAVILAGGASSRMGRDKAHVEIGGIPMLGHVANALGGILDDIIVVGVSDSSLGLPSLPDVGLPHRGPLAGVVAALRHTRASILAVAVDQPYLERRIVEAMVARFDGARPVVPLDDGVLQVTCAIYPPGFLAMAERRLIGGGSLRQAVLETDHDAWTSWPGDGRSWFSIDTPESVDEAIRRFGQPPM